MEKKTVWSSDIIFQDWIDGYNEFCEINEIKKSDNPIEIRAWMIETNNNYYNDELFNLDLFIDQQIIAICDEQNWYGYRERVVEVGYNLSDILDFVGNEESELFASCGNIYGRYRHHDGINFYKFRKLKKGLTEEETEDFYFEVKNHTANEDVIDKYTDSIYDDVAEIYGWN